MSSSGAFMGFIIGKFASYEHDFCDGVFVREVLVPKYKGKEPGIRRQMVERHIHDVNGFGAFGWSGTG